MQLDEARIRKPLQKLRKTVRKFPRKSRPEEIHKLRTTTRRIEAMLAAVVNQADGTRGLSKSLRSLRRRAGKVRDMDVFIGLASTLKAASDDECEVRLLEGLSVKRFGQAKKLHSSAQQESRKLRRGLKKCLQDIEGQFRKSADRTDGALEASVMSRALQLSKDLRSTARLGRNNLHDYRLKVKELRYVLQMAKDGDKPFVEALGEVKDAIGEWHDWLELTAIATELLDGDYGCELLRQLKETTEQKFDHALSVTNEMRNKYLNLSRNSSAKRSPKGAIESIVAAAAVAA